MTITLTLQVPDEFAPLLSTGARDLSAAALEALAVEEYRSRRLSDAQFRRFLGISRFDADRILKHHGVWLDYGIDDFQREDATSKGA